MVRIRISESVGPTLLRRERHFPRIDENFSKSMNIDSLTASSLDLVVESVEREKRVRETERERVRERERSLP
jgi:hypothetical protein